MKPYKNIREVTAAAKKVTSSSTQSDAFMYKCFPLMIKALLHIEDELHTIRTLLEPEEVEKEIVNNIDSNNHET